MSEREDVEVIIYDEEFTEVVANIDAPKGKFLALNRYGGADDVTTIESMIASGNTAAPPAPEKPGSAVILTSGTTGTPKGTNRAATVTHHASRDPLAHSLPAAGKPPT